MGRHRHLALDPGLDKSKQESSGKDAINLRCQQQVQTADISHRAWAWAPIGTGQYSNWQLTFQHSCTSRLQKVGTPSLCALLAGWLLHADWAHQVRNVQHVSLLAPATLESFVTFMHRQDRDPVGSVFSIAMHLSSPSR